MRKRILVFGAGFLGTRLSHDLAGAVLSRADITDAVAVEKALAEYAPDAVVNAAGKTGKPNVDWCETHQAETYCANVVGPMVLADACAKRGIHLVHLGSGCIFYGPSPSPGGWLEDDFANPTAFYSRCKYAADLVLSRLPGVATLRLRMPVDSVPGPRNLISKLAAYKQVIDVENSVTVVEDLVGVVAGVIQHRAAGVFHATNPGTMRHRDLLALYRELVDPTHRTELIPEGELVERGLASKARSNCVLTSRRLRDLDLHMRPIDVALHDTMVKYAGAARRVGSC